MAQGQTAPALQVERRSLKTLKVSDRNARVHSAAQIDQLVRSIETFGWTIPLLVDEHGVVIAGHGRLLAARKMGLKHAPCLIAQGWREDQKRAYRLADNRLAENSAWDADLLRGELSFLDGVDFDLSVPGFSEADLAAMVEGVVSGLAAGGSEEVADGVAAAEDDGASTSRSPDVPSRFEPNLTPQFGGRPVTTADVAARDAELSRA